MQLFVNNQPFCEVINIDVDLKVQKTDKIKVKRGFKTEGYITMDNAILGNCFLKYLQDSKKYLTNNWRKMHHLPLLRKRVLKRKK